MFRQIVLVALIGVSAPCVFAQQSAASQPPFKEFEVATIKPVDPGKKAGRYIVMQGVNRFVEKNYTLKLLIAAAYDMNPRAISGGPAWIDSDHYDILGITPG